MNRLHTLLIFAVSLFQGVFCAAQSAVTPGPANEAARVCESGAPTIRYPAPSDGCRTVHDAALIGGQFERALPHAVYGCEKCRDHQPCANVASLPRVVANSDRPVASAFVRETGRIARLICTSGMREGGGPALEINGSLCAHFARQFILAAERDEWQGLPADSHLRHFNALYDPEIATLLYQAACRNFQHPESCNAAQSVNARFEPRSAARRHDQADAVK